MGELVRGVEQLARDMTGEVLLPGSDAYDDARVSFNGLIDRRPAAIARCLTRSDVQLAVRCAADLDLPLSVRGGGHSVAGHGIGDRALVVDLSRMRTVTVDSDVRVARVDGGCIWDDVDAATQAFDLAVPGGTYGDTGVGGLTLGGGLGWLLGTAGLTCDNLVRAEVVAGTGEVVVAGEDGDPDLLWALRGGGGNFGVVTTFELRLHPRERLVGGYLSFAVSDLRAVLQALREVVAGCPDELVVMPWIGGLADADVDEPTVNVGLAYVGARNELAPLLRPLRDAAPVRFDDVGDKTYLEVQAMNGRLPFGLRHYWKGHFVDSLDAAVVEAVAAAVDARPPGRSGVLIEGLTGVARRAAPESAAFGQRGAGWNVSAIAIWESPTDDERMISWARAAAAALEPFSHSGGGYVNYIPPDETPERVLAAYGPERFARLAAVKRRYDPDNRLRFNLNIPPAGDGAATRVS